MMSVVLFLHLYHGQCVTEDWKILSFHNENDVIARSRLVLPLMASDAAPQAWRYVKAKQSQCFHVYIVESHIVGGTYTYDLATEFVYFSSSFISKNNPIRNSKSRTTCQRVLLCSQQAIEFRTTKLLLYSVFEGKILPKIFDSLWVDDSIPTISCTNFQRISSGYVGSDMF